MENLEGKLVFIYGDKGSGKTTWINNVIKNYNIHNLCWDIEGDYSNNKSNTLLVSDCYLDLLRQELVNGHISKIRNWLKGTNNICLVANRKNKIEGADIYIEL